MTQQEVYEFLKKNPGRKFTTKEINKILNYNSAAVNLKKLYILGDISMQERPTIFGGNLFWLDAEEYDEDE